MKNLYVGNLAFSTTEEQLREMTPKWERVLLYRAMAARHGRDPLESALQFSLRAESVSTTLLGMHKQSHLAQNLRFLSAPRLSADELREYRDSDLPAATGRTPA